MSLGKYLSLKCVMTYNVDDWVVYISKYKPYEVRAVGVIKYLPDRSCDMPCYELETYPTKGYAFALPEDIIRVLHPYEILKCLVTNY